MFLLFFPLTFFNILLMFMIFTFTPSNLVFNKIITNSKMRLSHGETISIGLAQYTLYVLK